MFEKKDYSKLSLEELIQEEVKIKKTNKNFLFLGGLSAGVALYGIFKGNVSFIHWALPLGIGIYMGKLSEDLKGIQKEIQSKNEENS